MVWSKSKWLIAGCVLAVLATVGAVAASAEPGRPKPDVSARFKTEGGVGRQALQGATTIPNWSFQFTDPTNGVAYPITMVGSHPRSGNVSTTVHTVIVPLKINFVAGV